MSKVAESEAVELLLDAVDAEGNPAFVFPGQATSLPATLPAEWRELLAGRETPAAFIARTWSGLQGRLPRTLDLLPRKTSAIALLRTDLRPLSLVYLFGLSKDLYANRGFAPLRGNEVPEASRQRLPVDLLPLQGVHDGWVDFFSLDGGVLPTRDWRVLGEEGAPQFLEIFRDGADALGVELGEPESGFLFMCPDEDSLTAVPDLWEWLDERYAGSLEDLEDV